MERNKLGKTASFIAALSLLYTAGCANSSKAVIQEIGKKGIEQTAISRTYEVPGWEDVQYVERLNGFEISFRNKEGKRIKLRGDARYMVENGVTCSRPFQVRISGVAGLPQTYVPRRRLEEFLALNREAFEEAATRRYEDAARQTDAELRAPVAR